MPLQIVGGGLGRTGTSSLRVALEILGFPCYHMDELMAYPEDLVFWEGVAAGTRDAGEWDTAFGGRRYTAAIDAPPVCVFKQLLAKFPDALVILTHRDGGKWYDSAVGTIYQLQYSFPLRVRLLLMPWWRRFDRFITRTFWLGLMEGALAQGRQATAARVDAWNAEVVHAIPPQRLLKFSVEEGWEPLCSFLGVPVPEAAFPHVNDANAFKRGLAAQTRQGWTLFTIGVGALASLGAVAAVVVVRKLRAK